jgi:hypothetical protein
MSPRRTGRLRSRFAGLGRAFTEPIAALPGRRAFVHRDFTRTQHVTPLRCRRGDPLAGARSCFHEDIALWLLATVALRASVALPGRFHEDIARDYLRCHPRTSYSFHEETARWLHATVLLLGAEHPLTCFHEDIARWLLATPARRGLIVLDGLLSRGQTPNSILPTEPSLRAYFHADTRRPPAALMSQQGFSAPDASVRSFSSRAFQRPYCCSGE